MVDQAVGDDMRLAMVQTPSGGGGGAGVVNNGFVRVFLRDRAERGRSQSEIATAIRAAVRELNGARVSVAEEASVGQWRSAGFSAQVVIQAATLAQLEEVLEPFLERARSNPAFAIADADLKFNRPEVRVAIQRDKAEALGVSAADIATTLHAALSGQRFGYFIFEGKQYDVVGQLLREDRVKTSDLGAIHVKTASGEVMPLDNLITVEESSGRPSCIGIIDTRRPRFRRP